jgi:hypothetical protein
MTSDEALMLEFQGGSRAAFEELFARYHKPLYGFFGYSLFRRGPKRHLHARHHRCHGGAYSNTTPGGGTLVGNLSIGSYNNQTYSTGRIWRCIATNV